MRGLILAGGTGSRLHPVTLGVSKQLVPVYDKPMIYYPLSTLMLAGIRDILVITTPHEAEGFQRLLGDGSAFGISISYAQQPSPDGLAQAFTDRRGLHRRRAQRARARRQHLLRAGLRPEARAVRRHRRRDDLRLPRLASPARTAWWSSTPTARPISLEEKPARPRSNFAVPGLYFYDHDVVEIARGPRALGARRVRDHRHQPALPRARRLQVEVLERGTAWLDTGTFESLNDAGNFIRTIEQPAGAQDRCAGGGRLATGLAQRRRAARAGRAAGEVRVRRLPTGAARAAEDF